MSRTDKDQPRWVLEQELVKNGCYEMMHFCHLNFFQELLLNDNKKLSHKKEIEFLKSDSVNINELTNFFNENKDVYVYETIEVNNTFKSELTDKFRIVPDEPKKIKFIFQEIKETRWSLECTYPEYYDFQNGKDIRNNLKAFCYPRAFNGYLILNRRKRSRKEMGRGRVKRELDSMRDIYNTTHDTDDFY